MLHLEDRCGSLEKGKDADFVVLSGAPFSVYTQVLETYIEGEKVFDRARHQDWTYQAGGFALVNQSRLPKQPAAVKRWPAVMRPSSESAPAFNGQPEALGDSCRPDSHRQRRAPSPTASSSSRTARSSMSARKPTSRCRPTFRCSLPPSSRPA